jgi:hypothetical protein
MEWNKSAALRAGERDFVSELAQAASPLPVDDMHRTARFLFGERSGEGTTMVFKNGLMRR